MAIVLSGSTNDITVNGVSVATDAEVSSAITDAVAPKANTADLKEIGVNQTWQDVTASRAVGTTYTNTTGKPIVVNIDQQPNAAYTQLQFFINSVRVANLGANSAYSVYPNFTGIIVPNGSTYSISGGALNKWMELR